MSIRTNLPGFTIMSQASAKLIVGLGNVGAEYEDTRHNVGFMAIQSYAHAQGIDSFSEKKQLHSLIAEHRIDDTKVILMMPTTLMNLSGKAVLSAMDYFKLSPEDVLIIYDDADLEVAKLRTRSQSGSGGHNGVKSVQNAIGNDFARLKIGVRGEKRDSMPLDAYVLARMPQSELECVDAILPDVHKHIDSFITGSFETTSN